MRRWLPWLALLVVVGVALGVGAQRSGAETTGQKVAGIASEVRCPQCEGQSAEASNAPAAKAVRLFIQQEVQAGRSKAQIERELVDRYGSDILLVPPSSGVAGLVWILPVVAMIIGVAGITFAFRRWRAL